MTVVSLLAEPEWVLPPIEAEHVASRSCYGSGCERDECRAENTRWMSRWRRDRQWHVPVEHPAPPEQLDLFAQIGPVTTPDWITA